MSGGTLFSSANTTASLGGAVVGDPSARYIFLVPTAYLRSDVLAPGDTGDPGGVVDGLTEFAIEAWFMGSATGTPNATEFLISGPLHASGFAKYSITVTTGGIVRCSARNGAGTTGNLVSPSGTIVRDDATWVHVVETITGGSLRLYINGVQADSTGWTGSFSTGLDAGAYFFIGSPGNGQAWGVDEVAFYRHGLTADRVQAHYDAGRNRGFPQQTTGARINAALDASGSLVPRQVSSSAGRTIQPSYMQGQSPLGEIKSAESAEAVDSGFFVKADGTLVFLDAGHRSSAPYNTVQVTLGDAGGAEIPYEDLNVDYSDAFLFNEVNVTRDTGGVIASGEGGTQTVRDTTSISAYKKRPQSLSSIPVTTDAVALTIGTAMLAKYKDPMQRITSISFTTLDRNVTEALFRRELMDKITVKRTPPGGGSRISQDLFIQKITVDGDNSGAPWRVTWGVSPV
jgi:Concanavalin A-like lectin/glucanases superfamily